MVLDKRKNNLTLNLHFDTFFLRRVILEDFKKSKIHNRGKK